jgi:UDP-N-acetyl-D-mannosaminuronate dehydrogenase
VKEGFIVGYSPERINPGDVAIVIVTAHREYKAMPLEMFTDKWKPKGPLIDVKSVLVPVEVVGWGLLAALD